MSAAQAPSAQGSPFWRFSLRFYRQPKVADTCIALQEEREVDVNLLLFLLWQATRKRALTAAEVAKIERRVGAWREMTVIPLRTLRRALKSPPPPLVAGAAAELFRTKVKAVELEAERLQQEAMYELADATPWGQDVPSLAEAARGNIAAYEAMGGKAFPKPAIETLLAALPASEPTTEE
jgi:uncharacterized protein (TIGR02444 family)